MGKKRNAYRVWGGGGETTCMAWILKKQNWSARIELIWLIRDKWLVAVNMVMNI
jgi:hypothetical protein